MQSTFWQTRTYFDAIYTLTHFAKQKQSKPQKGTMKITKRHNKMGFLCLFGFRLCRLCLLYTFPDLLGKSSDNPFN